MLTKEELERKITHVKSDIARNTETANPKILLGLAQYLEFLEEELKSLDKK